MRRTSRSGPAPIEVLLGRDLSAHWQSLKPLLSERIASLRSAQERASGFAFPAVIFQDGAHLGANDYEICLFDARHSSARLYPERTLAIRTIAAQADLDGIEARDPAFGLPGFWIEAEGKDAAQDRKVFEFCKAMGISIVVTEPDVAGLDGIEALVKEFDIKMAIHNHPKRPLDRAYLFWDPNYVLGLVKDRDPRMGSCADVGHWVRSGLDPVECIKILKGRIFDSHMKDLDAFGERNAKDMVWGTGKSDVAAVLNAYAEMGFYGPIDVEWEKDWLTSLPDVTACLTWLKNFKVSAK